MSFFSKIKGIGGGGAERNGGGSEPQSNSQVSATSIETPGERVAKIAAENATLIGYYGKDRDLDNVRKQLERQFSTLDSNQTRIVDSPRVNAVLDGIRAVQNGSSGSGSGNLGK